MPAPRGEALRQFIPALLLLCVTQACATLEVPVTPPQFQAADFFSAGRDGIEIRAKPIEGIDSYLELFDDNLPEIGIAAVWVIVRNVRAEEISLENARWNLRVGGDGASDLGVSQIFEAYYKRRGIRFYSQYMDERERADLQNLIFKGGRIPPSREQSGFVFFRIEPVLNAEWACTAVLGLRDIRISDHQKADLEVSLSYANP